MDETKIQVTEQERLLYRLVAHTCQNGSQVLLETDSGERAILRQDDILRCRDCISSLPVKNSAFEKELAREGLNADNLVCTNHFDDNGLPEYVPDDGFCHEAVKRGE